MPADEYVRRRLELGSTESARRFLTSAAADAWLVDTGYQSDALTTPAELAALSGAPAREVVRLESVAERVIRSGIDAAAYGDAVTSAVRAATASAVGFKSVAAYRGGLALTRRGRRLRRSQRPRAAGCARWRTDQQPGSKTRSWSGTASGRR